MNKILILCVILLGVMMSNVIAEEQKTYTFTEVKTAVFNIPSDVSNFLNNQFLPLTDDKLIYSIDFLLFC